MLCLAGHGYSGLGRKDYTMGAFGEDVPAVVAEVDAGQVILVGHSIKSEGGHSCPPIRRTGGFENPPSFALHIQEGGHSCPPMKNTGGLENPSSLSGNGHCLEGDPDMLSF